MRCAKCGNDDGKAGALFCPRCGATHGAPARTVPDAAGAPAPPARPATTVPDTTPDGAASVLRVLVRSRGLPVALRFFADVARAGVAVVVAAAAWGLARSRVAARLDPVLPSGLRDAALDGLLVLLGAVIALLALRLTSRRFVRPLGS